MITLALTISACRHIEKHQHCCTTHELIRTLLLGNCIALLGSIPARHLFRPCKGAAIMKITWKRQHFPQICWKIWFWSISCVAVRRWKSVVAVPSPELQAVLLEGCEKEGGEVQVVYPLPAHRSVSHREWVNMENAHASTQPQLKQVLRLNIV